MWCAPSGQLYLKYSPCLLQNHTNELRALLDSRESLQPLVASLHQLTAAANETLKEAKFWYKLMESNYVLLVKSWDWCLEYYDEYNTVTISTIEKKVKKVSGSIIIP